MAEALPQRVAAGLATGLGRAFAAANSERRAQVARHQCRITPGLSGRDLDERVRAVFDSYAHSWVSMFRIAGHPSEALDALIDVDGASHITDALALGNGAIMAMPHLGAWDLGGSWLAGHWPLTVVAERVRPPELFDWFCEQRRRNRMSVVGLDDTAMLALLAALRRNEVLGLLCDRDIGGGGVEVEFFGERTTLPAGPATLSLRTGAPILPNAVYQGHGKAPARGVIRPPIPFERSGRLRHDIVALTQLLATELESLIRVAPEQWHVLQPNWPSDRR